MVYLEDQNNQRMKVYYRIDESFIPPEIDESYQYLLEYIPENLKDEIRKQLELNREIQLQLIESRYEKIKFEIMWKLRSLEDEIKEDKGMIIIDKNYEINITNFSPSLSRLIEDLIREKI